MTDYEAIVVGGANTFAVTAAATPWYILGLPFRGVSRSRTVVGKGEKRQSCMLLKEAGERCPVRSEVVSEDIRANREQPYSSRRTGSVGWLLAGRKRSSSEAR